LLEDLQIPRLGIWGVAFEDIPNITAWSMKASSMKPNPVVLTEKECRQILEAAI
jgi:alcohol dehydrogenase class IV